MADGIDSLQQALTDLGDDARCSLEIRYDPAGAREAVQPIRMLRRDMALELQVLDHLTAMGAPSGEYSLRIREKGRHVAQATVSLRVSQPTTAVTPPVTPAVTAPVIPGVTPAVTPGQDLAREVGELFVRKAIADAQARLDGPEFEEEDAEDEDEEEASAPLGSDFVRLAEAAMASPVLAPALSGILEAGAQWLRNRASMSEAQARLYEARARRAGAPEKEAPKAPQQRVAQVVGFRKVARAGGEGTGTNGSQS